MSRVSDTDRAVYRALADALLPAHGAFPAASAADVAGPVFDRILQWRPDLVPAILRGLSAVRALPATEAVTALQASDAEAFAAIRFAALGAYYLDPGVMRALGYRGQESLPVPEDATPDYLQPGLLDAVVARGPRWRRV